MMLMVLRVLLVAGAVLGQESTDARVAEFIEQLKDERTALRASQALIEIGPEAVPQVVRAHRHGNEWQRMSTFLVLAEMGSSAVPPLVSALKDKEPGAREDAAAGLRLLATHARIAGYSLSREEQDETAMPALLEALRKQAVPALVTALDDDNVRVQAFPMDTLAAIGSDAAAALPRLLEYLRDEGSKLSDEAIYTIGRIGTGAKPAVEGLLKDNNDLVRMRASAVIRNIQVTELIDQLTDRQSRREAALALAQMGPDVVYPILRELEKQWIPIYGMRLRPSIFNAVDAVDAVFKGLGEDAVPPLVEALQDDNALLRGCATVRLGRLGEFARVAVPALKEAEITSSVTRFVQGSDLESIVALQEALVKQAVPALRVALKDPDGWVRTGAIGALGGIGEVAREALPDLLVMLKDGAMVEFPIGRMGAEAVPAASRAGRSISVAVRSRGHTETVPDVDRIGGT